MDMDITTNINSRSNTHSNTHPFTPSRDTDIDIDINMLDVNGSDNDDVEMATRNDGFEKDEEKRNELTIPQTTTHAIGSDFEILKRPEIVSAPMDQIGNRHIYNSDHNDDRILTKAASLSSTANANNKNTNFNTNPNTNTPNNEVEKRIKPTIATPAANKTKKRKAPNAKYTVSAEAEAEAKAEESIQKPVLLPVPKVRFAETNAIHEIDTRAVFLEDHTKQDLFYLDADYARFRASEEKRHNKILTKKLTAMVQEKITPIINMAVAEGATLADIEAMVPKTNAEMMVFLNLDSDGNPKVEVKTEIENSNENSKNSHKQSNNHEIPTNLPYTAPTAASSGGQLRGKNKKRTLRSTRSSIEISPSQSTPKVNATTRSVYEIVNEIENKNQNENANTTTKIETAKPPGSPQSPRTIRSSRSSIIINHPSDPSISEAVEDAAAASASAELIAQEDKADEVALLGNGKQESETLSLSEVATAAAVVQVQTAIPHKNKQKQNTKNHHNTKKKQNTKKTKASMVPKHASMVPKTHAEMVAYLGAKRSSLERLELSPKGRNNKYRGVRSTKKLSLEPSTPL